MLSRSLCSRSVGVVVAVAAGIVCAPVRSYRVEGPASMLRVHFLGSRRRRCRCCCLGQRGGFRLGSFFLSFGASVARLETQPRRMRRSTDDITKCPNSPPPFPLPLLRIKLHLQNVNDEALCSFVACSLATIFDFDGAVVGYEANRIYGCWMLPQLALTRGERETESARSN